MVRVYLKLGAWQWALSPGLDDDSIQGSHCNANKFPGCLHEILY